MKKTRRNKKRGGGIKAGVRRGDKILFEWAKPSIIDGRTCYGVGPFKWCTRKKTP